MAYAQGPSRQHSVLLAVFCCRIFDNKAKQVVSEKVSKYPFPEFVSSGRLEVQVLRNPATDEFQLVLETLQPNFLYLQEENPRDSEQVGSLIWGDVGFSSAEVLCGLFGSTMPTAVYLDIPDCKKLAESLHSEGVPYVIYWEDGFSCYVASHFRQAMFSVVQSSCSHTWDAFQLAHASFRLYCLRNNNDWPSNDSKTCGKLGPRLLGEPPKIDIAPLELCAQDEENSEESLPAINIYDDDVNMRFLVCGVPCASDPGLLEPLEDGLNALLTIEIRGSKLHNRTSAPPPPLQAGTFSRGVVTMRCDISTCSSAHISLLVSGSAQTCFNDQLLENHIKNELMAKSPLVHAVLNGEERNLPSVEPRKSLSVACGASVSEVCVKLPSWASQVLRQLAPDVSYRSLVTLGIGSVQGLSVASFEKDDAERLLFFCSKNDEQQRNNNVLIKSPSWLVPPPPTRKKPESSQDIRLLGSSIPGEETRRVRQKVRIAAMRPIPHTRNHNMIPFSGHFEAEKRDVDQSKSNLSVVSVKHNIVSPVPVTHKKSFSSSYQAQQTISLNPLPLKKHGCSRSTIQDCSEEEFLRDVMQFLILRGHTRLIPPGGLSEFPDAILNAKRLDLYNLYREVVSRGGFHVGNGINWKGQVFSKMRNHTLTNRMTGVGNTLKRHYETYLLEYELAHDDVDGECCLLCRSSAAGDWVNCGICGEWAHFGCDRRQGLGAFKDYAKTDGLDYICPHCSVTNVKKKPQKTSNDC